MTTMIKILKFLNIPVCLMADDGAGGAGGGTTTTLADGGGGAGGDGGGGTTPPPVTDIRQFISNESGDLKPGWAKSIGADEQSFGRFTSLKGLVESHANLQKLVGGDKIPLPKADASPAEWDAFYAKLGRPEKPDGYGLKKPDDLPAEAWDDARTKGFSDVAHKLGLTPKQAQGLMEWELGNVKGQMAMLAQRPDETTALLRQEWGAKADTRLAAASALAHKLGGDELVHDPYLGNHPLFIRMMDKMAGIVGERGGLAGARDTGAPATGADLKSKVDGIMGDRADPYWNAAHPQHKARVAYVVELHRQIREASGG
jgi:hypothetical protein